MSIESLNSLLTISHIGKTIFLSLLISILSFKFNFLTKSGTFAVLILAFIIYGIGGWQWTVPIVTFFISSSVLSKVRKSKNQKIESFFEKTGRRDYVQVFANGGTALLLIILYFFSGIQSIYMLYVVSIAAVCADTWATEIGTMKVNTTYSILNLKKVDQGISGGISFIGILGAFAGTFLISLSSLYWVNINYVFYIFVIAASAVFATVVDSILGSTLQAQYKCVICNSITEKQIHCDTKSVKHRGLSWMNNDAVNFLSSLVGVIFCFLFLIII